MMIILTTKWAIGKHGTYYSANKSNYETHFNSRMAKRKLKIKVFCTSEKRNKFLQLFSQVFLIVLAKDHQMKLTSKQIVNKLIGL